MPEILETTMLVCFGFSWPLSVVKNIRAGTAKSMSLPFILLIVMGYVAGISAKLITGRVNYVLVVYLINFVFVSSNIFVYMVNHSKDKKNTSKSMKECTVEMENKELLENISKKYASMNRLAEKGGTVFFGSDMFAKMNVAELAVSLHTNQPLYYRGVDSLPLIESADYLPSCIFELEPGKVFIEIGNYDLQPEPWNVEQFISRLEWLLYTIHNKTKADIILVFSASRGTFGKEIWKKAEELSKETGCQIVDVSKERACEEPELHIFNRLRIFMYKGSINYFDAINHVTI